MQRQFIVATFLGAIALCQSLPAAAEEPSSQRDLLKALSSAKVTLQQGMEASAKSGKPISAKYELENGALQLSVYTAKSGTFNEVVVDHGSGRVAKVEQIKDGDDLSHARAQAGALAKTKHALRAAADKAEHDNPGYRTVSLTPASEGKRTIVQVVLAKGEEMKSVSEALE
ncbi:MAG: hypothetical protein V4463_17395 [Pseudomonadota bacterium]